MRKYENLVLNVLSLQLSLLQLNKLSLQLNKLNLLQLNKLSLQDKKQSTPGVPSKGRAGSGEADGEGEVQPPGGGAK